MTATPSSSSSPEPAFGRAVPWVAVVLGPLLLLGPALLRGEVLFWGTPLLQFVPWHTLAAEIVRSGELPLWNPWLGMGAPLLANYQSALLYPPNWLMLWIDPAVAQTLLTVLHWVLAGAGMVALCRLLRIGIVGQTVAGVGYALSGYLVSRAGFQSINITTAWLPWALWATERLAERLQADSGKMARLRAGLALSAILGLQWLGGHAQTSWYSICLVVGWFAWRLLRRGAAGGRGLAWLGASLAMASGLAAAQLLPTLEFLLYSQRSASIDPELAMTYSLWPWRLLGLWFPGLFGSPAVGDFWGYANYWEDALYVGTLAAVLALAEALRAVRGRSTTNDRSRFLLVVVGLSLALALGSNTPLFPILYKYVPTFGLFQAPTRWSLLAVFCLCLLAAAYADSWRQPEGRSLYWTRLGTAAAGGMLVVSLLGGRLLPWIPASFPRTFALAGAALGAAGLLTLFKPPQLSRGWLLAFLVFMLADLVLAGQGLNPTTKAQVYQGTTALAPKVGEHRVYMRQGVERALKFDALFRFDAFAAAGDGSLARQAGLPNVTLLDGTSSANNFDPLLPARYAGWIGRLEAAPAEVRQRMLAWMDVSLVAEYLDAATSMPSYSAVEAPSRLRFAEAVVAACSPEQASSLLEGTGVDRQGGIVLETPDCGEVLAAGGPGEASVEGETSSSLTVRARTERGGWLILADTFYPGWRASVDGRPVDILPAQGIFRAVWIPPGEHSVHFAYRPWTFMLGAAVSGLSLALWLGAAWAGRKR